MATVTIYTSNGFDDDNFWVGSSSESTGEQFTGQTAQSGTALPLPFTNQSTTYSAFSFTANGLDYVYRGSWSLDMQRDLLTGTATARGWYDTIEVSSGGTLLATWHGSQMDVDFGSRDGIPLVDLVVDLVNALLGNLIDPSSASPPSLYDNGGTTLSQQAYSGDDTHNGGAGNDSIEGDAGNDQLFGGAGNDVVSGGTGDDLVAGGSGQDLLTGDIGNDQLYGDAGDDQLYGGDGSDYLNGQLGADVMVGGAGNDVYDVDSTSDVVVESSAAGGSGSDTVYTSVTFALTADVENLVLLGTVRDGGGNDLDNNIRGNASGNVLTGAAGYDVLTGGAGNDAFVFLRGAGVDFISDFDAGPGVSDVIYISSSLFSSYTDILAHAFQVETDTVIRDDVGDTLVLQNVTIGSLAADDFVLY